MKKLYFGTVRDIKSRDDGLFSLTLEDIVTGRSHYLVLKLTHDEVKYLKDVVHVPYIFVKINERFYVRILMTAPEIDKEFIYV